MNFWLAVLENWLADTFVQHTRDEIPFINHLNGGHMKKILVLTIVALLPLSAHAGESAKGKASSVPPAETGSTAAAMVEDDDGILEANEYEVIDPAGSITRALCPYTCAMRGLEARHCKTWRSVSDPKLCYVQDTRIPTDAINWGSKAKGE